MLQFKNLKIFLKAIKYEETWSYLDKYKHAE